MTTKTKKPVRRNKNSTRKAASPIERAVEGYIEGVLNGKIVAGELTRLAVKRHLVDLEKGKARGLYFDKAKAERAIEFFGYLKHSKGEWAGQFVKLEPWQMFIKWVVFGWMRKDGTRRFRNVYLEVARKNGKALEVHTIVATPAGWKQHGELIPGDYVFGPDGLPKRVLSVSGHYVGPCHTLRFSDGAEIIGHASHEWQTNRTAYTGRPSGSRKPLPLVETAFIAKTLRHSTRKDLTHSISVTKPLQLPVSHLPIPPYTLGAWLGDGHSAGSRLTCADSHIVERIEREGVAVKRYDGIMFGLGCGSHGGSKESRMSGLTTRLKKLGVLNNKHIPLRYLRSSDAQRRDLLSGLMDTDGHVTKRGQCEIVLTRKQLFDSVVELLTTLGYKPTCKTDTARINGRAIGPRYRVQFWAKPDDRVVSLPRKANRLKATWGARPRSSSRMIVSAEPCGHREVNCIEVEGGFYLAGRALIATHNSTDAAGTGLYLAFADDEPGAEVYSTATKKDQAIIVHSEATRMVHANPEFKRLGIETYKHNICRPDRAQKYEPLGADEDTLDGYNVHASIVDELHAHKTRGVYDLMDTGTSARRQPILWAITTAGTDQTEASVCWEQHVYTEQILRGFVEDDSYFGMIFCLDTSDDWTEEKNWYKANPNLGVSKKLDYMREQAIKAKALPSKQNTFKRLDLNEWTQQATRWIDMGLWDANAGPVIDETALMGRPCYGGIDLSSVSDITAWLLLFPDPVVTDRVTVLVRLWCPEARLQRVEVEESGNSKSRRRNLYAEQYQAWSREGLLLVTPGNAIDYAQIEAQVAEDAQRFHVQEIAVDRLFQGYQFSMNLQEHHGLTVAACGMGYMSMAGPCAEFERRLLEKKIHHGGHPVLRWMANNVAVREDPAGNKKPDKSTSQGKIDGIVALLLGLDRVMRQQNTASVYETRGMLTVGG